MADKEAIAVNELVARNVHRLRRLRGWTQAQLAERISFQSGDEWDHTMVSKAEWNPASTRRPRRQYSPDELVAMARVFDVSLLDLFVADDDVLVEVGGSSVRGGDFFRIAFMMPARYRYTIGESLYAGRTGRGDSGSELHRRAQIVREAIAAVYTVDEVRARFPDAEQLDWDQMADLLAEREEEVSRWVLDNYGREALRSMVESDRMLDVIEEAYPGTREERQRRQGQ